MTWPIMWNSALETEVLSPKWLAYQHENLHKLFARSTPNILPRIASRSYNWVTVIILSEAGHRQAWEMLFICVILQSQQGWQHAITKPVLLWDGICNSNIVHCFPLSFITELFILLVSKLWVSWYLQVYLQLKVGVIISSFFRQHTLGNSFFCWTMFLTKAIKKKGRIKARQPDLKAIANIPPICSQKPRWIDVWMFMPGIVEQGNNMKLKF